MKEFPSLLAFGIHLAELKLLQVEQVRHGLDKAAALVERAAKAKIGVAESAGLGGTPWAALAPFTQQERVRLGYTPDETFLREGQLRDSVGRRVGHDVAVVGSDRDEAVYGELGTQKQPPRSFLASAAAESAEKVRDIVGRATMIALRGR